MRRIENGWNLPKGRGKDFKKRLAQKPLLRRGLFLVGSQAMPAKLHKPRLGASSEQVESLVSEKMRQTKYPERAGEQMRASGALAFGTWNFETRSKFHRKSLAREFHLAFTPSHYARAELARLCLGP